MRVELDVGIASSVMLFDIVVICVVCHFHVCAPINNVSST